MAQIGKRAGVSRRRTTQADIKVAQNINAIAVEDTTSTAIASRLNMIISLGLAGNGLMLGHHACGVTTMP